MNITATGAAFRMLKPGDKNFTITDGFTIVDRAGFEISTKIPHEYQLILLECISKGFIKPVAYIRETEYVWDILK